ncbi:pyridoxamine 5'-phosphate oxidase family protein [Anthocerotibacter panamensis]|uniref:pyridoxamine 5'-phosphate oxidase family protein n=1 Tax=Anthocerotibacter panamensis TaxID=2857077 RepID=UPI001C403EDE|nr:pyridoxamine 5'-phosphate oxidase family protein [Anthocerotibacter panamensis]
MSGWTHPESPFHAGEIAIQERLGVRDQIDKQARRIVRDYLPEQHRLFFAQLPFLLVGTVVQGHPWASILVDKPGFLSTPDERTLHVASRPLLGDPLAHHLSEGIDMGLLGIEFHTRRRNRLNGVVVASDATGFTLQVGQSFGNCPMYIQSRTVEWLERAEDFAPPLYELTTLGPPERTLIGTADTFFIATAFRGDAAGRAKGVDVSHRGGKPGFVRIEDERTLMIPDFTGNFHFNTLGNLLLDPHAGLLFLDFKQGDLLYLTGTAELIWEPQAIQAFAGAERLLRFHLTGGRRVVGSLPLRWSDPVCSPFLERMG